LSQEAHPGLPPIGRGPGTDAGSTSAHLDQKRGILLAGLGVLLLTPDSLLIRLIQADTATLLFWRGLLQCLVVFLALSIRWRGRVGTPVRALGGAGWGVALLMGCGNLLFIVSIRLTTVANTLLMVSSSPLLGAIFTRIFLQERVALRTWVAALAGLVGVGIILSGSVGAEGSHWLGDLMALLVAVLSGATFVLIRSVRDVSVTPAVGFAGGLVALLALPWVGTFQVVPLDLLWLACLGVIIMPISFSLIAQAPRYIPAPEVSLLMLMETVLGPLWVWMVLSEVPPPATWLGGAVLIGAVALHSMLALREALRDSGD
jgi:drug/metabolite transporter (DMT)-like permease